MKLRISVDDSEEMQQKKDDDCQKSYKAHESGPSRLGIPTATICDAAYERYQW